MQKKMSQRGRHAERASLSVVDFSKRSPERRYSRPHSTHITPPGYWQMTPSPMTSIRRGVSGSAPTPRKRNKRLKKKKGAVAAYRSFGSSSDLQGGTTERPGCISQGTQCTNETLVAFSPAASATAKHFITSDVPTQLPEFLYSVFWEDDEEDRVLYYTTEASFGRQQNAAAAFRSQSKSRRVPIFVRRKKKKAGAAEEASGSPSRVGGPTSHPTTGSLEADAAEDHARALHTEQMAALVRRVGEGKLVEELGKTGLLDFDYSSHSLNPGAYVKAGEMSPKERLRRMEVLKRKEEEAYVRRPQRKCPAGYM